MAGATKRIASVPREALDLAERVSKADLLEAAWFLAAACNGVSADDDGATMQRLHEELQLLRANRGARPLPPLEALLATWAAWAERRGRRQV